MAVGKTPLKDTVADDNSTLFYFLILYKTHRNVKNDTKHSLLCDLSGTNLDFKVLYLLTTTPWFSVIFFEHGNILYNNGGKFEVPNSCIMSVEIEHVFV